MSVEGLHAANRLGGRDKAKQGRDFIVAFFQDADDGRRQEVYQMGGHPDRAGAGSAAAVRDSEGLVQVEVHQVDAQVTGADDAEQRVQVGAVTVDQAAAIVHDLDHFFYVLIEQPQRIGVGQHQADDGLVTLGFQGFDIHVTARIGGT